MPVSETIKQFWDGHFSVADHVLDQIAWDLHLFNINILIW